MAWPAGAPPPRVTTDLRSCRQTTLHFHCAFEIRQSQSLAHMLDSLVRVSRRAARDDAKAEPTLASRFALAVAQSFANRPHCTKDQAGRGRTGRTFHGAPAHVRKRRRPDTALKITTGNKTGQRGPDLSMPNKGRRAADRRIRRAPTPKRCRRAPRDSRRAPICPTTRVTRALNPILAASRAI